MEKFPSRLFVVMGVCGCGKSSIGNALAEKLGGAYFEGDDFHPASNIKLMETGTPLTDEDRWPWLETIATKLTSTEGIVFAGCSALKKSYRNFLIDKAAEPVFFIHLSGTKKLIKQRMSNREGHFMPLELIESQFATLEIPDTSEDALSVDISGSQEEIVHQIIETLRTIDHASNDKLDHKN